MTDSGKVVYLVSPPLKYSKRYEVQYLQGSIWLLDSVHESPKLAKSSADRLAFILDLETRVVDTQPEGGR